MFDLGRTLIATVERSPGALAVVDGARRLTYVEWAGEIARIVAGLEALGLQSGEPPVTIPPNPPEAAAPAPRRARGGAGACRAEPLRDRRAPARSHAAIPHDGRPLAPRDDAGRRLLRLPAALRRSGGARAHRAGEGDQPLPRADALSR